MLTDNIRENQMEILELKNTMTKNFQNLVPAKMEA